MDDITVGAAGAALREFSVDYARRAFSQVICSLDDVD